MVEEYDEIAMTRVMLNVIKTTSLRNNHTYISLVIRYVSADFMKAVKYLVLQAIKHGSLHFENLLAFLTSLWSDGINLGHTYVLNNWMSLKY